MPSVAKMDRSNQAVLESRLVCTIAGHHAKVPNRYVEQTRRSILKFGEAANFLDKYSPTAKKAAERSNQQNSGKSTNSIKSHPRSGFIFPRPSIPRADAALMRPPGPTPRTDTESSQIAAVPNPMPIRSWTTSVRKRLAETDDLGKTSQDSHALCQVLYFKLAEAGLCQQPR
jgi:hypothetical protein